MATQDKILILAADPDEGVWSIVLQTDDKNEVLEFWERQPKDTSKRIQINTGDFIDFPTPKD